MAVTMTKTPSAMAMNESSDDAENVLNAFQDFLNQYSVDETSVLGDSNEFIPGSMVSYSPSGVPSPRTGSSKNSPRPFLQSSSSSPSMRIPMGQEMGVLGNGDNRWSDSADEFDPSPAAMGIHADTKSDKTTKFDRSFFLNSPHANETRGNDPDIIAASRTDDMETFKNHHEKEEEEGKKKKKEEAEEDEQEKSIAHLREKDAAITPNVGTESRVNTRHSGEGTRLENLRDGEGEDTEYVNKVYNEPHTQANKVDGGPFSSNSGPLGTRGDTAIASGPIAPDEATDEGGEMGNSTSGRRHQRQSATRGDRVRIPYSESSLDDVFRSKDEKNNNIDGPSYVHTDNDSYIFDDGASIENILYGDKHAPKHARRTETNSNSKRPESDGKTADTAPPASAVEPREDNLREAAQVGDFSVTEIVSTDFRHSDSKNRSRMRDTYSAADLVIPELIIGALGDISDDPTVHEDDVEAPPTTADSGYAMSPKLNSPTTQLEHAEIAGQPVDGPRGRDGRRDKGDDEDDGDYPIIFRRSKNHPGSKKYQAVVNELSSVLEKRTGASRTQSMRENSDIGEDGDSKSRKSQEGSLARRVSRSTENLNVFANKSLLSKLENHLLSRQGKASNPGENNSSRGITMDSRSPIDSETAPLNGSTGTNPSSKFHQPMSENGDQPSVTTKTTGSGKRHSDTYGKRVSAKLIYDHSGYSFFDQERYEHDISFQRGDHIDTSTPRHSDRETSSDGKTFKQSSNKITASSSDRKASKSDAAIRQQQQQQQQQHQQQQQQKGHSLNWARSRAAPDSVDGSTIARGGGIIFSSNSSSSDHRDSMDRYAKKKKHKYSSSILVNNRRSLDYATDSSTSTTTSGSRGHVSTIEICGRGVKRRSTITYSEPDIYHRASGLTSKHSGHSAGGESSNRLVSRTSSFSSSPPPPSSSSVHHQHSRHPHPHDHHHHRHHSHRHRRHSPHRNDSWASSRDASFSSSVLDETGVYYFDQNSLLQPGGGTSPMSGNHVAQQQKLIKVNGPGESSSSPHSKALGGGGGGGGGVGGILTSGQDGTDTYFITTSSGGHRRPISVPSGAAALANQKSAGRLSGAVSMTTIVEHTRNNGRPFSADGKARASSVDHPGDGTAAWTSVIDQHGHARPVTVYRAVSLRSPTSPPSGHQTSSMTGSQTLDTGRSHAHLSTANSIVSPFHHASRTTFLTSAAASQYDANNGTVHYVDHPKYNNNNNNNNNDAARSNINTTNNNNDDRGLYVVVPSSLDQNRSPTTTTVPDIIGDHQHNNNKHHLRGTSGVDSRYHGDHQQRYKSVSTTDLDKRTQFHTSKLGSPFHQEIFEGALPPANGDGLHRGEEDKAAVFFIDSRGMQGEPSVQVEGPNSIAKCSIDPQTDGQYKVTYIPTEVGLFNAQVRWNGKEIPGSPFHPKVVDSRKVRVVGGWQHYMDSQERVLLVVGEEKVIPFDTSDAGPGHLRAEVKSPSAFIPVSVDDEQKGKSVVKFVPKEEGNHYIHLYWSDHPLVNSPYLGYATSGMADPSKVWLSGRGLKEGVVMEENEFFIDGSQAGPGEPEVELTGVRAEVRVFTTRLGGGKYRCTYIPKIPGAYLLHISWNGRQLRGSPYKVNVIGASYPSRVVVNGEGLRGGLLGQNLDFRIDTRKAGPGELTAYCMGPSQVAYCELSDHHDGTYKLAVRAQEVGRHVLQIKYGGEHVQGSPFSFKVSAQPDASKVRVSGPGVEHGLLANFQSQFIVETKGAGAGQLTVRIRGPRGAFQVEMYRESQKDRTILCRYYPTVTGLYVINVRWSGIDVPGSPFHVNILDTQQELEQILNEQSLMANGHHPNFHNISSNSINHSRVSHNFHQANSNINHHNTSRNSAGYYQWQD